MQIWALDKNFLRFRMFNARKSGSLYKVQQLLWFNKDLAIINEEFQSIDLQMTSSVFVLLIGGIISAIMVLIIEITWNHIWRARGNNHHQSAGKWLQFQLKNFHHT